MNKCEAIEERVIDHACKHNGRSLRVSDEEAETILSNLNSLSHPIECGRYQTYLKTKSRSVLSRALSGLHYYGVNIILDNPIHKKNTGKYY